MEWITPLDLYCERVGTGFWAEPLNAWSNLSFPLAALWAALTARKLGPGQGPLIWALIVLGGLIGVGSFLFHVFANTATEYADVIPIWSFVALYVFASVHLLAGVPPGRLIRIGLIVAVVVTVILLATSDPEAHSHAPVSASFLNGSGQYAPALIALLVLSIITFRRSHPIAPWALAATATFIASLVFRTLDHHTCAALPLGTHFIWHLLNGLMVGLLLQGLLRAKNHTSR